MGIIERIVHNKWDSASRNKIDGSITITELYQVKAFLVSKKKEGLYQDNFIKFLTSYKPAALPRRSRDSSFGVKGMIVFNKQDSHQNKYDIRGNNDITHRFNIFRELTERTLIKASLSVNIEKTLYIIGSDQFNSEWTGMTTKGTPHG